MLDFRARGVPPRLRSLAVTIGLVGTFALCATFGFYHIFSILLDTDDEGCMLVTIEAFNDGHALYDEVFSTYGPLPWLLKWGLYSALRRPVGHDVGRLICLGYWLATAASCGVVAGRLTRSMLAGWAAFLLAFLALAPMANEPGHPQELCGLLLAIAASLATFVGPGRRLGAIAAGLGVVAACLALTKINAFIFLAMALGAALLAHTPKVGPTRVLLAAYVPCLLAAPTLLMSKLFEDPLIRAYAFHVTLTLIPVLILGFGAMRPASLRARHYACTAAGFAVAAGVILGVLLLRGTTPRGLLEGLILIPLRTIDVFGSTPFFLEGRWLNPASFGLVALAWVLLDRAGRAAHVAAIGLAGAIRLYFGASLLMPFGHESLFIVGLPAASLILIPRIGEDRPPGDSFGRVFLAFLAATQSLYAFPVAGTQVVYSTFLAIPAMVILVADGCRDLAVAVDLAAKLDLAPARDLWMRSRTQVVERLARSKFVMDSLRTAHVAILRARESSRRRLPTWLTREVRVPPRIGRDLDLSPLRALWAPSGRRVLVRVVQVWIVSSLVGTLYHETRNAEAIYRLRVPLKLRGSSLIRANPATVDLYRRLTLALRARPDTFFSMPGMNSLYFWTDRRPPTSHNVTNWMSLLDDRRQRQVIERLEAHPDICLVVSPPLIQFWLQHRPLPATPLVRYLEENFTPAMKVDHVMIKVRKSSRPTKVADLPRGLRAGDESRTGAIPIFHDDRPPATSPRITPPRAPSGPAPVQDHR